ncbi:MAG: Bax inhibitor-1/YccA family protein [Alphaproteobacteria bacterium]|nr:Bax inhibitor-1/YccA family protein [Alphaproteobacteria bacterium]
MALNRPTLTIQRSEVLRFDAGLRAFMLRVYQLMGLGLVITGAVAYAVANIPVLFDAIFRTPLAWVVMLAPLGIVFLLGARVHRMSPAAAQTTFWIFSALMGASLATVFVTFTGASIARVFFITAAAFGGLSLYGYTTRKSLSGWGSFLIIGLIGVIVASLVNIFVASSALHFAVSVIGVLIFAGLTAYDTQRLKVMYDEVAGDEHNGRLAIMGALSLYLNFINIFMLLLQFFGAQRQ